MESFVQQSVEIVSVYVCVVFSFVFFFFTLWLCLWTCNLLGSSSLLWSLRVFKHTAVGFMEALKPFVGLFHNGSILSFALVQGVDPGSFVSKWIPMQVWSCNHLVPHHCWVRGQPGGEKTGECSKPLNVFRKPWDKVKVDNGDMTNQYRTITTFSYSQSWIKLGYTGLLRNVYNSYICIALGRDRVVTVWSILSWYDNVKRIAVKTPSPYFSLPEASVHLQKTL